MYKEYFYSSCGSKTVETNIWPVIIHYLLQSCFLYFFKVFWPENGLVARSFDSLWFL